LVYTRQLMGPLKLDRSKHPFNQITKTKTKVVRRDGKGTEWQGTGTQYAGAGRLPARARSDRGLASNYKTHTLNLRLKLNGGQSIAALIGACLAEEIWRNG
jgi:hypothetical protein